MNDTQARAKRDALTRTLATIVATATEHERLAHGIGCRRHHPLDAELVVAGGASEAVHHDHVAALGVEVPLEHRVGGASVVVVAGELRLGGAAIGEAVDDCIDLGARQRGRDFDRARLLEAVAEDALGGRRLGAAIGDDRGGRALRRAREVAG